MVEPQPTQASVEAQLRARIAVLETEKCFACGALVTEACRRGPQKDCGREHFGGSRAALPMPEMPDPIQPSVNPSGGESLAHLGNVLQMLAELSPGDRCRAFDEALDYYNAARPDAQVLPQPGYVSKLVMVGPLDWIGR